MAESVTINRLGGRGDGIADTGDGPLFVPYALPGETATVERDGTRAHLVGINNPSQDRAEPFCPYFGACGGCAAQHMASDLYRSWKSGIVEGALRKAGIDTALDPLVDAHGEGRRRVTFHARFREGRVRVGYMAARSHDLIEIDHCPIAEPSLKHAPVMARHLAEQLARSGKPLDIQVTATENGYDVDIRGHGPLKDRDRLGLVDLAGNLDLARLSLHGDVLVERRAPFITIGSASVTPPPGSFLQATRLGEETLAGYVREFCGTARRIADLFSGCGPFALRLAEQADVHAVENDRASIAALDRAGRLTPGLRRVTTEARDLFRRPLLSPELNGFEAVVVDPPRAGAEAQFRQLATSNVPVVASVSCDAGTFARDAAILIQSGYRLERVVPVDQFKYTAHVEIVGVFRKEVPRRRK